MIKRILAVVILCSVLASLLSGCAYYGIYEDKRLLDTMSNDKSKATRIKTAILNKDFTEGLSLSVYCFYNKVYIVGEIPQKLIETIENIAKRYQPDSVTIHNFPPKKGVESDFLLATRLRTHLIKAKGLSSTRIETEVNAGRCVLLGVVESDRERAIAKKTAHRVPGIQSVTSYLLLPPNNAPAKSEETP
ncbi:MAG: BON domain-containing protein [Desulfovibrio sp.]|nr:BON domain-containing protein [Desulfovibrio sp.]